MIAADRLGARFVFDRQRRVVTSTAARLRRGCSNTWGLRNVSFSISAGEGVALLGPSGSGKTTLLRLLAGIYVPDEGSLEVRGRVASLLSTEAGLLSPLTGRENALQLGVLAGLSRGGARAALGNVKELSALDEYFERPVGAFSQGMRARLGFAVAQQIEPQILLLDEVHEAFDHEFRDVLEKCGKRLLAAGGIVVAAGHDHPMLKRLCQRALHLEHGSLRNDGLFGEVQERYLEEIHSR